MLARMAALLRLAGSGIEQEIRQPRPVGLVLQHHLPGRLIGEHVLLELRAEHREPLHDLGHPCPPRLVEAGPGAGEHAVIEFQHPQRLGIEAEAVAGLPERLDPGEERGVQQHLGADPRELRHHRALDLVDLGRGVGARLVEEGRCDPAEPVARTLQRLDRVDKAWLSGIARNGGDLGALLGNGGLEGLAISSAISNRP